MNNIHETRALRFTLSAGLALMLCILCLAGSAFALKAYADYTPPQALTTLWEINNDVIGGLAIPGTEINYPILQHTIDDYYLNVCFDGSAGKPGAIYANKVDGKTFDTYNTVVYGRNMADGSYFGSLSNYLDIEYLDAHREIDIYAVNAKHVYRIFAVVVYDDRRITDYYTDGELLDQWAFLQSLQEEGQPGTILLDDMNVDAGRDHILTLSTGITDRPNNRLLVVAVER